MEETGLHAVLGSWEAFYLITGGAAAALTGLQFVVVTLINDDMERVDATPDTLGTFGTPTVVHFSAALFLSTLMSAPWHSLPVLRTAVLLAGAFGVIYGIYILVRALRQRGYRPVLEDWVFHVVLPLVAYAGLAAAAPLLVGDIRVALFIIGAVTLLLLFIGIHNAWDTVAYLTVQRVQRAGTRHGTAAPPEPPKPKAQRRRRR